MCFMFRLQNDLEGQDVVYEFLSACTVTQRKPISSTKVLHCPLSTVLSGPKWSQDSIQEVATELCHWEEMCRSQAGRYQERQHVGQTHLSQSAGIHKWPDENLYTFCDTPLRNGSGKFWTVFLRSLSEAVWGWWWPELLLFLHLCSLFSGHVSGARWEWKKRECDDKNKWLYGFSFY